MMIIAVALVIIVLKLQEIDSRIDGSRVCFALFRVAAGWMRVSSDKLVLELRDRQPGTPK